MHDSIKNGCGVYLRASIFFSSLFSFFFSLTYHFIPAVVDRCFKYLVRAKQINPRGEEKAMKQTRMAPADSTNTHTLSY